MEKMRTRGSGLSKNRKKNNRKREWGSLRKIQVLFGSKLKIASLQIKKLLELGLTEKSTGAHPATLKEKEGSPDELITIHITDSLQCGWIDSSFQNNKFYENFKKKKFKKPSP